MRRCTQIERLHREIKRALEAGIGDLHVPRAVQRARHIDARTQFGELGCLRLIEPQAHADRVHRDDAEIHTHPDFHFEISGIVTTGAHTENAQQFAKTRQMIGHAGGI